MVYLDGERIAEATDDADPPAEGLAAMVAQWFAAESETVFEDFRVLVVP